MESDRVHARGVIMREAQERRGRGERRGRLARLAARLRRARDHRRRHPRAGPPHPRPRRDAGRHLLGRARRGRGARAGRRRALDGRRRPRRDRDAARSRSSSTATARTSSASTPGSSSDHPPAPRARLPGDAAALRQRPPSDVLARDPDLVFLANGPGDPGALDYVVENVRGRGRQEAGGRHLPRPPAPLPRGRPRHLQAPLRPPRRQPPGQGPRDRPHRHHLPEPRLRGQRPRGRGDDRGRRAGALAAPTSATPSSPTSTSTTAPSRASSSRTSPAARSSTTPRPARAPTTPATSSTASWSWPR